MTAREKRGSGDAWLFHFIHSSGTSWSVRVVRVASSHPRFQESLTLPRRAEGTTLAYGSIGRGSIPSGARKTPGRGDNNRSIAEDPRTRKGNTDTLSRPFRHESRFLRQVDESPTIVPGRCNIRECAALHVDFDDASCGEIERGIGKVAASLGRVRPGAASPDV